MTLYGNGTWNGLQWKNTRYKTPRIIFFPTCNVQCMIFMSFHNLASFGFHKPTRKPISSICFKSMFSLVKTFKEPTNIQNAIKINDHWPSFSCLILQRVELKGHKMRRDLSCCLKEINNEKAWSRYSRKQLSHKPQDSYTTLALQTPL